MTTYRYENTIIGRDDGATFVWAESPSHVGLLMHTYGPAIVVHDDRRGDYSGDDFWALAGELAWDTSAVPS